MKKNKSSQYNKKNIIEEEIELCSECGKQKYKKEFCTCSFRFDIKDCLE